MLKKTFSDNDSINLAMFFDDKYFKSALVTLLSVLNQTSKNIYLYTSLEWINENNKSKLFSLDSRLKVCSIDGLYNLVNSIYTPYFSSFPPITLSRLFLPFFLPNLGILIYADSDIVFKGDISLLLEYDFNNNAMMARGADDKSYFNSGLIVYNMSLINRIYVLQDMLKCLKSVNFTMNYPDQDIMNLFFKGHIGIIPDDWEFKAWNRIKRYEIPSTSKSVHYIGRFKPFDWHWISYNAAKDFWFYGKQVYGRFFYCSYCIKSTFFRIYVVIRRLLCKPFDL